MPQTTTGWNQPQMDLQSLRPSLYETSLISQRVIQPDWESVSVFVILNLQGPAPRRAAPSKAVPRDLPCDPKDLLALRMCVWHSFKSFPQPGAVSQLGLSLYPWNSLQGFPKGVDNQLHFSSHSHSPNNTKFSSIKAGHQALFIIWKLQTRPASMCEPAMGTCCYDNNMRLNHPDRQDTHNCVITCSHLFKGNFISAAEGTLVNKA